MTRLFYEIIKDIPDSLPSLDRELLESTGYDLWGLAVRSNNVSSETALKKIKGYTAAVISMSSGEGLIQGFSEAVAAILEYSGLEARVTRRSDVAGLGEALAARADIFFIADDHDFLALNVRNGAVVDNSRATAQGFVHALAAAAEMSADGLTGRKVLVLGLGPVGMNALQILHGMGVQVWVYDIDPEKTRTCTVKYPYVGIAIDVEAACREIDYIVDATPAAGIINESVISRTTIISCPGVPHGLTPVARIQIGSRFIHDNLALGVAIMAVGSAVTLGE